MPNSPSLTRRQFVTLVGAALSAFMGTLVGLPAIGYLLSPALERRERESWISLGPLDQYPLNQPTLFTFTRTKKHGWEKTVTSYGVYVLRTSPTQVRVFSNVCTHLSCRVRWDEEAREYICPCHDGHFAIDGAIISGPQPRPLDEYETKIEGGNLFILLREA
ncbi:MAG: ubiquinol-cytochrome c reductase iron-sulfur subunit [Anaerolineales bacterium]|nr:ubiquinol-cytochrome c reductase iron-sulfur subunit [Anaerolineales bacterium]MCS7248390.1 ubiquinol-cytochrome c reductase iron-sulfur subunit [Anaerolineales bacterium]MDW8162203.1 ubiquinol-cytochrome c reductase iron-sulfur subunit [Anaerolineales bacterium]MDW8447463.1 ubiquinol-cytochrome c reductase iron-sulfur subunit [Anaerolineales bacterium]